MGSNNLNLTSAVATDTVLDEQKGPLGAVADPVVSAHLNKIWNVLESRLGYQTPGAPHVVATQADIASLKLSISKRFGALPTVPNATPAVGGGSTTVGAGGGSANLLPLNNVWTGQNSYNLLALQDFPVLALASYNNGTLPGGGNLLTKGLLTVLDIRKTTDQSKTASAGLPGGVFCVYLQHSATGQCAANSLNGCIRVQMQTTQSRVPGIGVNDAVAGYFSLNNFGTDVGGFTIHGEAVHGGTASGMASHATYVFNSEIHKTTLGGVTVGFHTRTIGVNKGEIDNDYAFLASVGGSTRFVTVFAAGSLATGGVLGCDFGLDLSYASCTKAAIMIPTAALIQFNAPALNVSLGFNPVGSLDYSISGTPVIRLGNDGSITCKTLNVSGKLAFGGLTVNGPTVLDGSQFRLNGAKSDAGPHTGGIPLTSCFAFVAINLDGFVRWFPCLA